MVSIYSITNKVNGKRYIGQSKNISRRWSEHRYDSANLRLNEDMKRYGLEFFVFEVIDTVEPERATEMEILYIQKLNTLHPNGYNIKRGNEGYTHSEEIKKKISEANKGRKNALGCKRSEETKQKMRQALLCRKKSPEHIENMSKSRLGKKQSPETIEKKRLASLGRVQSQETIAKRVETRAMNKAARLAEQRRKLNDIFAKL